jgi:hypothetical protein
MLLVMDEPGRGSLDPTIGRSIVAFGAAETCALESRAAIAAAGDIVTDFISQDLTDVAARREAINADAYLPPAWQIGLDETFLAGMANAMTFVTKGLTDADWEGPANTAEELCLKAILDHASEVIPDVWKIEDRARLKADVMDLREIGFQDIDHEFLFEPEMDGIDQSDLGAQMGMQSLSRRDAFKRFGNR